MLFIFLKKVSILRIRNQNCMWNKTRLHITFAGISIHQNRLFQSINSIGSPCQPCPEVGEYPTITCMIFFTSMGWLSYLCTFYRSHRRDREQPRACASVVVTLKAGLGWHLLQNSGMPLDLVEYSNTSLENMDDLSSRSRAGLSNSATRPSLRTRTTSLSITVGIR